MLKPEREPEPKLEMKQRVRACAALTEQNTPCENAAVDGSVYCGIHRKKAVEQMLASGGVGLGSRYASYLSKRKRAEHERLVADASLLDNREETALVTRHIGEIEQELSRPGSSPRERRSLFDLQIRLITVRRTLIEAELRRLQIMYAMVPRAKVAELIWRIAAILRDELDETSLARVTRRITVALSHAGYLDEFEQDSDGTFRPKSAPAFGSAAAAAAAAAAAGLKADLALDLDLDMDKGHGGSRR